MGFMDELKKLTQPYDDDEDDFYEGADSSFAPSTQRNPETKPVSNSPEEEFENSFGNENAAPAPRQPKQQKVVKQKVSGQRANGTNGAGGSIFGNFGDGNNNRRAANGPDSARQNARPMKKQAPRTPEQQVVLFNPKDFDEAGELVTYITQGRSLVMALEGIPTETARRLLDFISGICFALNAKITPVSAKTYFVTPENVDILDAQALQKSGSDNQDDF